MKRGVILSLATILLCTGITSQLSGQGVVRIAAAANLRYAMEEIEANYESANSGVDIQINYGASGMFFQQISNGAPYNLFLSADEGFPAKVVEAGLAQGEAQVYACGALALYGLRDDVDAKGLVLLKDASIRKISIANPRTAPYGARSVELLKAQGMWDDLEKRVIYGESISQAAQFATTGNVDLGFVALSLLLDPKTKIKGSYYKIPQELYAPIAQAGVLIKQKSECAEAAKFFEYILSPACTEVWDKYGYFTTK
ncbi:MAG: molybdate ABC transporter substrate-binding protein [Rikenellaceae bacterium]